MLENDVHPAGRLTHRFAEIRRVERGLGADLDGALALGLGTAGCKDPRAQMFRDPDRGHRNARAGADHEDLLTRLDPRASREHPPGGEERERKGGGLAPRELFRLAKDVAGIDVQELTCGPVGVLTEDTEARAHHVLTRATARALPIANDRIDDHLVAGLPGVD